MKSRILSLALAMCISATTINATLPLDAGARPLPSRVPVLTDGKVDQDRWAAAKRFVLLDNGQRLAYVEAGDPDGQPLLLIHGYTDTSRVWTTMLPSLSHYRLIMPDQRGHGASDAPPCCYAVADFAYDASLLLEHLGVEKAYVAGHSLGSIVAQEMAATYGNQIRGIALLASTGKAALTIDSDLYRTVQAFDRPMTEDKKFLDGWMEAEVEPSYGRHTYAEAAAVPLHVWKGVLDELVGLNSARHAARVTQPVLTVSALDDELFDEAHLAALDAAYPDARRIVLEEAGHNFPMRMPTLTAKLIDDWIKSNAQG